MRQAGDLLCGEPLLVYSKSGWMPACFQHAPLIHSLAGLRARQSSTLTSFPTKTTEGSGLGRELLLFRHRGTFVRFETPEPDPT
jgi:hypothetical protein